MNDPLKKYDFRDREGHPLSNCTEYQALLRKAMDNKERHGHVTPLPDGLKARCGGPALCPVCQREQAELEAERLREENAKLREAGY